MAAAEHLLFFNRPKLTNATMLLALTGWMDGGAVSTGTIKSLMDGRELIKVGMIDPDPFYIYNFPGPMEVASLFRPEVKYDGGVITEFDLPENIIHADPAANLVFFVGKEPNLRWRGFSNAIFSAARELGVKRIIFMGSFGGSVPHTREPRLYGSVSNVRLLPVLSSHGITASDYGGPSSFATYLLYFSEANQLEMISLAAEIPGYLEGMNPLSIEAVTRRLGKMLNTPLNLDKLRRASNEWEAEVTAQVIKDEKLAATVRKLEEQYDNELIQTRED
jgi:proteasome assembly chaperone (PAC2) family protein